MDNVEVEGRSILKFDQLPDYPTFRDVQRALWGASPVRGAALMVGAGFSRLASPVASGAQPLPLWSDFADRMISELYPSKPADAPSDPLRLAEEYRAVLGQTSLDSLIREMVQDEKWCPDEPHRRIVQLPWSDILTTNWDTLLERAASTDPERAYELVVTPNDIPRTRAPRIVKLHGSLPSNPPFIFTQEDFRTYPSQFAPFVNLAQQVLLENELCLIGFSGNDPNFLQWAGWVRDQLGASARPIRLIGVLDLTPSQRALLSRQNITPIDLAPLVEGLSGGDRHSEALRLFIDELYAGKPSDPSTWARSDRQWNLDEHVDTEELLERLKNDRQNHPGWLITPPIERRMLRRDTQEPLSWIENNLSSLGATQKSKAAFELSWRLYHACWPMPVWLVDLCEAVVAQPTGLSRADQLQVCVHVAQAARLLSDWGRFDKAVETATSLAVSDDEKASVTYQICLRHRDNMKMSELEANVSGVIGRDPAWMLRKAALLSHMMRHKEAALLVRDCAIEVRRRRTLDRKSLWLISREAWTHLMLRQASFDLPDEDSKPAGYDIFDEWPHRYTFNKCDPWDEIRHFDDSLEREIESRKKRQKRETPRFDAGTFKRHGSGTFWRNGPHVSPWQELSLVADQTGICGFGHVDLIGSRRERSAELLDRDSFEDWLALTRSIHKREDGLIEDVFGRTSVARLSLEVVEQLLERLRSVIDYGRSRLWQEERLDDGDRRHSGWLEQVRLLIEIASRLVVRLPTDKAIAAFKWACEIGHEPEISHWWLYEPLTNLLERTLDAIPEEAQCDLALDMVRFPTASHTPEHGMLHYWPNFANRLADLNSISRSSVGWDSAVAENIELVKSSNLEIRTRAILKLLPLFKQGILKADERNAFRDALWAQVDKDGALPRNSNTFPFVFLNGPEPLHGSVAASFRFEVVDQLAAGNFSETSWTALAALPKEYPKTHEIFEARDAEAILNQVLDNPSKPSKDHENDYRQHEGARALGRAMANTLMPALRQLAFSEGSAIKLLSLADPITCPELMQALPEITFHHPEFETQIIERVRRSLASSQAEQAHAAISAAIAWSNFASQTERKYPAVLATEIANVCLARRPRSLYGALYAAFQLARNQQFSNDDQAKLAATLDLLLVEADYQNVEHDDPLAMTLSLVRKECVKLADALSNAGVKSDAITSWLDLADDPMPEVRFALLNMDE